jgi:ribonuclease J
MARLTFYGGVAQIGGNKILVEDRDARVWLDMGATFSLGEEYFAEYLMPRERFGLRDYFALDLVDRIPGLFSMDALEATDVAWREPDFSGVFISHVHYDHTNHIRFLDGSIPLHMGQGTAIILESWMTTARSPTMRLGSHDYRFFRTGDRVDADGIEVEPIHVDHSAPAAYGFLVHTSGGTIAYTGDLRRHGPKASLTDDFVEAARKARPVALITEGTRVAPDDSRESLTEADVKARSLEAIRGSPGKLPLVTFYPRDVDRMRTFVEVARAAGRRFVLSAKAAHLLMALKKDTRIEVPDVEREDDLLVYARDLDRLDLWERDVRAKVKDRAVDAAYVRDHAGELVLQLDFTHLAELVDVRPPRGSPFLHSKSEPFEEDDIEDEILNHWLDRFGLVRHQLHASGHMSEPEIAGMVRTIYPKVVYPVHTEHPDRFTRFAPRVVLPERARAYGIS